jgi:hypothetical protein
VMDVYPQARVRIVRGGLIIMPARPHVARLVRAR